VCLWKDTNTVSMSSKRGKKREIAYNYSVTFLLLFLLLLGKRIFSLSDCMWLETA